ncbi:hypothetical protein T440DRAFT_471033 [Plenodomus tracheiphilus IPT5]|uniref:Uncharacterized protein n=1 Tax=Plenodomus tracheiphilus IPT5 TaxID=1408161 RepID=A0A6A7AZK8_9PLEO|nr:hypothetical protein T440DRAFT_471033 [Plenodomus tracheiphilus IPT5]
METDGMNTGTGGYGVGYVGVGSMILDWTVFPLFDLFECASIGLEFTIDVVLL